MADFSPFISLDVTVSLNQSEYLVVEQELSVEVCVSLSGPIERTVLVELTSLPVTATDAAGVEYCISKLCPFSCYKS